MKMRIATAEKQETLYSIVSQVKPDRSSDELSLKQNLTKLNQGLSYSIYITVSLFCFS